MPRPPQTTAPHTQALPRSVRVMGACLMLQLLLGLLFTLLGLQEPWLLAAQWVLGFVCAGIALQWGILALLFLFA